MQFKRRRKSGRRHGSQTAFRGAKERTRGSGNRGGKGMSGTGKRADHRKSFVINITGGNNYFGKDRTLRRGTKPKKLKVINLSDISLHHADKKEINLEGYKILGEGELTIKAKIKASAVSESAKEKISASGSTLELVESEESESSSKDEKPAAKPASKPAKK